MLLWQDFPLQWGYARSIRKQAVRQVAEAVDLLGHHPVGRRVVRTQRAAGARHRSENDTSVPSFPGRFVVGQELPSWNKTVLDRSVRRKFEKDDGSRPVIAHSGVLPHPPKFDGTDSHLYFGWYHGDERDFPGVRPVGPADGAVRQRVRRAGGARDGRLLRAGTLARPRLGSARPRPRPAEDRTSTAMCHRPTTPPSTSGEAATPGVPGHRRPPAHRDAASPEVPPDGRIRPVHVRRQRTRR